MIFGMVYGMTKSHASSILNEKIKKVLWCQYSTKMDLAASMYGRCTKPMELYMCDECQIFFG